MLCAIETVTHNVTTWLCSTLRSKPVLGRFAGWMNSEPALAPAQNQHFVHFGGTGDVQTTETNLCIF